MARSRHPLLLLLLLLLIGIRTAIGAPCCLPPAEAAQAKLDHAQHVAHHEMGQENGAAASETAGHMGHGDDPSANPCCSACGPTMPPEPMLFAGPAVLRDLPEPTPIRALATRPPFPAYEARGPPLRV